MLTRFIIAFFLLFIISCSKKDSLYEIKPKADPYKVYLEAYQAFETADYFFAQKKFNEAELAFENIDHAAKASIMSIFSLYSINFYEEAIESINRFLEKYPANENKIYAHYLTALIYFEQISDEKKDIKPLIQSKEQIDFFLNEYPNTEYAIDLKFKKDLIINQMAAKELFVAKYYISTQKWIPAINRLKIILKEYDKTIFIEEALHRLVEIHYYIGLDDEAKKYASILGYNYNSSEWFKQSYKIFNRDYELIQKTNNKKDSLIKRILNKIKI